MDIQEAARQIVAETHERWRSLKGRYAGWDSGFAVFYSPVRERPDLLILGLNPGGDEGSFVETTASRLSTEHDYFAYDYPLAKRMRELFAAIGQTDQLRASVKSNLIFFRTGDIKKWRAVDPELRHELENFCMARVQRMITALQPKMILTEGIDTFDRLLEGIDTFDRTLVSDVPVRRPQGRLYVRQSLSAGPRVVGITHPTGTQVSSADWRRIEEELRRDLVT
jgi:hypothetical protein